MLKRSSEILDNLQNEKKQISADINYLLIFKKHFETMDSKVINKNTLEMSAGNVRGWVCFEYSYMRLSAYTLSAEGFTDYRIAQLKDCYINIDYKGASYIPEGKKKEVINAAAVNNAIDETITQKRDRLATLETITDNEIRETLKKYNAVVDELKKFYADNKIILDEAGIDYELKNPHHAVIDAAGYRPINQYEAKKHYIDAEEITRETAAEAAEYIKIKKAAFQILKSGGWRENNICDLADQYGYIITGNRDNCTIYALCVDNYNVMPCASVSISRGVAC